MALRPMKVSRRARQETSGRPRRPPILRREQRTPTWVVWPGAAGAAFGARTHSGSKHRSGVRVVTTLVGIDWKGGILHSGRFLVCMCYCPCVPSRLDIPSVHLNSHVSVGVMCLNLLISTCTRGWSSFFPGETMYRKCHRVDLIPENGGVG